ncbi:BaiN/RdsA family NAD(P)/FAD-dependent oxidoreductase [Blautia sp.]|uniref:NAD(P)/FAD-dependent oxidoreductase n=1 Tax=Blautia sp. TaxID=1955243 RepID=UPI002580F7D1|nr:NAD(P)/FAD-dependent oxidoreductase [Blautia sp.]
MKKVVIIGGGASGMMAAIQAARTGAAVTLLEHNEKPGKKILATGNGRCNLTNLVQEPSRYRSSQPDFPWKIITQYPLEDTLAFFSELGIYTKDRNGWVYPYSDQAAGVAQVLELEARHQKVKIKTTEEVTDILREDGQYLVKTATWQYPCDSVIISCGSSASNVEGSSTTGYELAEKLGHTVVKPLPSLCGIRGKDNYYAKWAGSRMDGRITLEIDGETVGEEQGEILFTEYGISGIGVFQLSRYAVRGTDEGKIATYHLDLMPQLTKEELVKLLLDRQQAGSYKNPQELLIGLLPRKMIDVLVKKTYEPEKIAERLKDWQVPVKGAYALQQAQICSGGVDPRELTEQLESRLHPGIYFTGEVIDVDGPCGGYNLQWAWSSGAVAGRVAAEEGRAL